LDSTNAVTSRPSLAQFERLVARRDHPAALQLLSAILHAMDERYGRLDNVDLGYLASITDDDEIALVFCTRFAAALGRLLTDTGFSLSAADYEKLLLHHRWIDLVFSLSGFRISDSFFHVLGAGAGANQMTFEGENFLRLLLLLSLNSRIGVDFEQFWRANPVGAALAFLQYISSRYVFSSRAFEFRERLLEWLPDRLSDVKFGSMTLARLPEIYMHCSYAVSPRKHAIKRPLMVQMRQACLDAGCVESEATLEERRGERPTIVVVAEHLLPGHAVFRTHSKAVKSLRERFHVAGLIYPDPTGSEVADFFDEVIPAASGEFMQGIRVMSEAISARKPALVFYLGVGMVPHVIALASLRLAPVQCVSFGHTATTMSAAMDYFILPEDFVGSEDTFSEKVLGLPRAAMPFAPRPFTPMPRPLPDGTVRVAIPASTMKLNPLLFDALARIAREVRTPTEFQFFPLAGTGLPYVELARVVKSRIPGAKVFPEAPHDTYMERLSRCDMFLCPFPYGNMNSIVDSFRLGLPGICLDGPEAHAHADVAIFARIGLPPELAAKTADEYVAATVRMIDDAGWRAHCSDIVQHADLDAAFFSGDARIFSQAIAALIWPSVQAKTSVPAHA